MFDKIKTYIINNFEQSFVIVVIIVVLLIILGITSYVIFQFDQFMIKKEGSEGILEGILSLVAWAGFLVLSGYVVGLMRDRSEEEKRKATQLNVELKKMFEEGQKAFLDKKQFDRDLAESQRRIEELEIVVNGLQEKMLENLLSIMDPRVANLIFEKKLGEERREISVLSATLADFIPYAAKKQPRTVAQTMSQFLSEMEQLLTDFHAHMESYSGGTIECQFGIPVEYETHPVLAVVAAIRMQEKLRKIKFPWDMQVGIASGSSVAALLGRNRKSYTALGAPVENALRLRMACRPGHILIDQECYNRVSYCIEAKLVKEKDQVVQDDVSGQISDLERRLTTDPDDIEALQELGEVYLKKLHEPTRALKLFEQALKVDPDNTKVKLAYAEANIEKESVSRTPEAGTAGLTAYEVIGTRNPLFDKDRVPRKFSERYASIENLISIPPDLILPIEAIDGSIGHSRMVAVLSYAVAETLGLNEEQKKDVLMAGYIQDIGKKLIPHEIISRTRRLTNEEFAEVRKHPIEATRVLSSAGFNKVGVLEIVEHHHERYNGKGYPHGKSGDKIPIGARITAVADSYDAMVAWRPYKKSYNRADAITEIKRGARSGFYDPTVVQAFLSVIDGA
jgi:class 3 adenylate cyclase